MQLICISENASQRVLKSKDAMRSKTTNLSEGLARIPFSFALTAFAFCLHSSLFSSAMLSHMTEACLLASAGLIPLVVAMVNIQKPFVFGGILDKIKKG